MGSKCGRAGRTFGLVAFIAAGCGSDSVGPQPQPQPPDSIPTVPSTLSLSLDWSTYLGRGNFEEAREPIALGGGRVLFSLRTLSTNMPTTGGAFQSQFGGHSDTYLGILSADGSTLEAATYFGGSGMERPAYGMELTTDGDIVFTSGTNSTDLPATSGRYLAQNNSPVDAGYVCRVSPTLTAIRWCTYLDAWPRGGLALTPSNEVIVVGHILQGSLFTATPGAYQSAQRGFDDAFVMKLSADGRTAAFKTRLGGTGTRIGEVAISATYIQGDIVVSGISQSQDFPVTPGAFQTQSLGPSDFFVARFSGDGSQLEYSTLLSGSDIDAPAHRDAATSDGAVVVGGGTNSPNIRATAGAHVGGSDLVIARFDALSPDFDWIRVLGGTNDDRVVGRAVDAAGRIIVVGETYSSDFPVSPNAVQTSFGGGARDGVVVVLSATGAVLYSTFFGGSGDDWIRGVAVGANGAIFIVGATTSNNLPGTAGSYQSTRAGAEDAFIARLTLSTSGG